MAGAEALDDGSLGHLVGRRISYQQAKASESRGTGRRRLCAQSGFGGTARPRKVTLPKATNSRLTRDTVSAAFLLQVLQKCNGRPVSFNTFRAFLEDAMVTACDPSGVHVAPSWQTDADGAVWIAFLSHVANFPCHERATQGSGERVEHTEKQQLRCEMDAERHIRRQKKESKQRER